MTIDDAIIIAMGTDLGRSVFKWPWLKDHRDRGLKIIYLGLPSGADTLTMTVNVHSSPIVPTNGHISLHSTHTSIVSQEIKDFKLETVKNMEEKFLQRAGDNQHCFTWTIILNRVLWNGTMPKNDPWAMFVWVKGLRQIHLTFTHGSAILKKCRYNFKEGMIFNDQACENTDS